MTTYTKETAIYNTEAIQSSINDARDYYVTSVSNDGVWVTPHDAKPVNGQPVSTTRGWHIANALEYFRGTVRYIKAWLNGTTPTVRLGQDASGHADVTPDGLEVLTDESTSVAQFGADGARIGTVDSDHISLESGNISFVHDADVVFDVETNSSFTRTIELAPYLTNLPRLQHQNMSSVTDETYTDTKDFVIDQNIESGDVFTVYVKWNIQTASSSWINDEGECSFTYGTSETKQVFSISETNIVCEGYVVYASPNTLTVRLHVTRQQPTSFILSMSAESVQYDHTFIGPFYRLGKSSANGPGLYAIDHGTDNYTGGTSSMASGENNTVGDYARNSFAVGESNTVHEKNSAVFGTYNSIGNVKYNESPYGNYFMFGEHLQQSGQIYPNLTIGRYNQITSNTELFAIGNGTSSARSNALTVDGNGNMLIAGDLTVNSDKTVTANKFISRSRGISYIQGAKGNAALYAPKETGSVWYPAVCLQTSSGGSWQIGNYNNDYLQFVFATKANIDSQTNTTVAINLPNTAGTICLTGHDHAAGDITSGTLADARLPTKGSAGTAGTSSATSGATLAVPYITTDAYGRVTAKGTHTHTIGSLNASAITAGTLPVARGGTGLSTLGSYTSFNFSSQSVANATATDLKVNGNGNAYFTYPSAGVYYAKYSVWFSSNATGRRLVNINGTSKDVGVTASDLNAVSGAAVNGAATKFVWSSMTFVENATEAATKRYVSVYQNSGGALNCAAYVRLFKIANSTS